MPGDEQQQQRGFALLLSVRSSFYSPSVFHESSKSVTATHTPARPSTPIPSHRFSVKYFRRTIFDFILHLCFGLPPRCFTFGHCHNLDRGGGLFISTFLAPLPNILTYLFLVSYTTDVYEKNKNLVTHIDVLK